MFGMRARWLLGVRGGCVMPKTRQALTRLIQARVTPDGEKAIIKAAEHDRTSVAEFVRRTLYKAAGYPRAKSR